MGFTLRELLLGSGTPRTADATRGGSVEGHNGAARNGLVPIGGPTPSSLFIHGIPGGGHPGAAGMASEQVRSAFGVKRGSIGAREANRANHSASDDDILSSAMGLMKVRVHVCAARAYKFAT